MLIFSQNDAKKNIHWKINHWKSFKTKEQQKRHKNVQQEMNVVESDIQQQGQQKIPINVQQEMKIIELDIQLQEQPRAQIDLSVCLR